MPRVIVSALLIVGTALLPAYSQESNALAKFIGAWSCRGNFTSNGAPIAADLSIQLDERSGALILRHDDLPPGAYHALEIWMMNKEGGGARAAISDKHSGMRWFESPGWVGNAVKWTRFEGGIAAEQFAYEFRGDAMQVQWSIVRNGAMQLGDSLLCRRA
jgi:hypothetical protein